ncbi:hypothetical protein [Rhizobium binae]|uniref:hypothetical protein n=1 Tax=Rhizobium binae TaxID=1138190 RepID=UPI003DA7E58F
MPHRLAAGTHVEDGRERLSWSREECEPVRRGRKQWTAVAVEAIETKASFGHTRSIEVRVGVTGSRPDGTQHRQPD